jgi:hypothetical protein
MLSGRIPVQALLDFLKSLGAARIAALSPQANIN